MTDKTAAPAAEEPEDAKMTPQPPAPAQKPAKKAEPKPGAATTPAVRPGGAVAPATGRAANPQARGGGRGQFAKIKRPAESLRARPRRRHYLVLLSFIVLVVAPAIFANWYLHQRAADQYASNLAFTIQSDEGGPVNALDAIIGGGGGGAADDAEVLYGFIQSQNLVETLEARLSLRERYNKPAEDWFFRLGDDPSIEALVDYWQGMALVAFEAGIVEVEVRAFDPDDAQAIARAVLEESTAQINRMSEEAREDAVRDAREYLAEREQRLKEIRTEIAELRAQDRLIDPTLDLQAVMGRISLLEANLQRERLRMEQLREFAPEGDSRVAVTAREIQSLETLLAEERAKLGSGDSGSLSSSIGRFEILQVDRELAEQAYAAALVSFEQARADARRKQRYLSAHIAPTLSETPQYPERYILGALATVFLLMGWVVLVMISYNVRDRR